MIYVLHALTLGMLFMLFVPRRRMWIVVAVAAALIVVLTATSVEMRFWTAVGVPSITSLALLASVIMKRFGLAQFPSADRILLLATAGAGFVCLEPSALGFLPVDLYRYGFSPLAPLVVAVAAVFFARKRPVAACVIAVMLVAFDVSFLGSRNLWDYIVDPILGIIAILWFARKGFARLRLQPQFAEPGI